MMYPHRFILGKKCTILMRDVDNRKSYAWVGAGVYGKTLPFSQFCGQPKTALRNKVLKIIFIQEK